MTDESVEQPGVTEEDEEEEVIQLTGGTEQVEPETKSVEPETKSVEPESDVPELPKDDMADMFAVPQPEDNDMYTDDLFEVEDEDVDMEDDLSDLTQVTEEDILGAPPRHSQQTPKYRRTSRRYEPPTSLGGVR